jgi:hypothetical protein
MAVFSDSRARIGGRRAFAGGGLMDGEAPLSAVISVARAYPHRAASSDGYRFATTHTLRTPLAFPHTCPSTGDDYNMSCGGGQDNY